MNSVEKHRVEVIKNHINKIDPEYRKIVFYIIDKVFLDDIKDDYSMKFSTIKQMLDIENLDLKEWTESLCDALIPSVVNMTPESEKGFKLINIFISLRYRPSKSRIELSINKTALPYLVLACHKSAC